MMPEIKREYVTQMSVEQQVEVIEFAIQYLKEYGGRTAAQLQYQWNDQGKADNKWYLTNAKGLGKLLSSCVKEGRLQRAKNTKKNYKYWVIAKPQQLPVKEIKAKYICIPLPTDAIITDDYNVVVKKAEAMAKEKAQAYAVVQLKVAFSINEVVKTVY